MTTGGGDGVCARADEALLPPPHPAKPNSASETTVVNAPLLGQLRPRLESSRRAFRSLASKITRQITRTGIKRKLANGGTLGQCETGIFAPLPVVVTVTEKGTGFPLDTCTTEGAVHLAARGAPAQAKDTLPLKPAPGVNCKLN